MRCVGASAFLLLASVFGALSFLGLSLHFPLSLSDGKAFGKGDSFSTAFLFNFGGLSLLAQLDLTLSLSVLQLGFFLRQFSLVSHSTHVLDTEVLSSRFSHTTSYCDWDCFF